MSKSEIFQALLAPDDFFVGMHDSLSFSLLSPLTASFISVSDILPSCGFNNKLSLFSKTKNDEVSENEEREKCFSKKKQ